MEISINSTSITAAAHVLIITLDETHSLWTRTAGEPGLSHSLFKQRSTLHLQRPLALHWHSISPYWLSATSLSCWGNFLNALLWKFQTCKTVEIIVQWTPVYSPPRFYNLYFTMLAVSYIYLRIVLPFYQSILPLDDFQSKLQISVIFPTHPNISACTLTRVQYVYVFKGIYSERHIHFQKWKHLCNPNCSWDREHCLHPRKLFHAPSLAMSILTL